jgi:hypothetical protein
VNLLPFGSITPSEWKVATGSDALTAVTEEEEMQAKVSFLFPTYTSQSIHVVLDFSQIKVAMEGALKAERDRIAREAKEAEERALLAAYVATHLHPSPHTFFSSKGFQISML